MNKVLKKALGFASALVLMAVMVLAASPVQASDVDARIQALERELVQLKQNQEVANESALAAEAKGPSFKYSAGKGLKIAAADNNWSITFGQRLQIYTSLWLTNDNPKEGYQNGVIRVRRFRPYINVTSQQGFYEVKWTFNGNTGVAFDGDVYLHFEKMNPFLPTVAYGYNPSFSGNRNQNYGRTEDSPFINALSMGGSQDGSVVLAWTKLPAMGISKINHLELAMGLDDQDEYGRTPIHGGSTPTTTVVEGGSLNDHKHVTKTENHYSDGRSMALALGIQPLAKAKGMGGFDVSSLKYAFAYETMKDLKEGPGNIFGPTTQERVTLVKGKTLFGDHTYMFHGLSWSPLKWLGLAAHLATYEGNKDGGSAETEASEIRLAAKVWLWGPKSGMMGGSKKEGGIYVSPMYSATSFDRIGGVAMDTEASNNGVAVVYNVPGGWMQIHGVWDSLGCKDKDAAGAMSACDKSSIDKVADPGKDSFNVFTLIVEYRF